MTSIPASRSARAMIFAPRSCPSSPGLATTTRILPLEAASTAGRDATRHAAAGDSRCPHPGGARTTASGDRRPALARRGLHLAGRLSPRPTHLPRPAERVREHATALLPADVAIAERRRGMATTGGAPGGHRLRRSDLLGREREVDAT